MKAHQGIWGGKPHKVLWLILPLAHNSKAVWILNNLLTLLKASKKLLDSPCVPGQLPQ